ncbi:hypothetical protein niasHS_017648 [Heterodera schachtii]|uniref:Eukaryotic translation initiation factor 2A n=1 Tax=Heterodera schachtii TaxID=97005 RepID=A0ABD2HWE8_HETSC
MGDDLVFAVRGSFGYSLQCGIKSPTEVISENLDPKDSSCRCFTFSNNGVYFAYCNSNSTTIVESSTGRKCFSADLGKTQCIIFSPKDSFMVTYEPYVIYGSRKNSDGSLKTPNPNLRFWSVPNGELLATVVADKQAVWKPYFSADESLMLRVLGSEVHFFKNGNFAKAAHKVVVKDIASFSISPGTAMPHFACFIPSKNQPAMIQLRSLSDSLEVLFSKASFTCDRCIMNWNSKGNALLVTASVDVDKSNKSYYGVSHLYCLLTKSYGDCFNVTLNKQGPVHCVQWAPNSKEFCVCYGFMPSKVSIFNTRGDTVWELSEGHRNEVYFNPQSTILVTCGFGNIASGKMEFWNLETRSEICAFCAPHTTHFEWAPDGQHICTSTTAPRLRTDNGFKLWTYRGDFVYEQKYDREELWEIKWRPCAAYNKFKIEEPNREQSATNSSRINDGKAKTPFDNLPKGSLTQTARYVPPHLRGKPQKEEEKGKKETNSEETDVGKKIRTLQKKLDDISKLKTKRAAGHQLELNQMDKIRNEERLLEEMERLTATANC